MAADVLKLLREMLETNKMLFVWLKLVDKDVKANTAQLKKLNKRLEKLEEKKND